jgi:hypothetical protein
MFVLLSGLICVTTVRSLAKSLLTEKYFDRYTRPVDAASPIVKCFVFRSVRKIAKSDFQLYYVRPSARMEQLGFHWTDFD